MSASMTRRNLLGFLGMAAVSLAAPPLLSEAAQAQPAPIPPTGTERRVERRIDRTARRQDRRIRRVERRQTRREGRMARRSFRRQGRARGGAGIYKVQDGGVKGRS